MTEHNGETCNGCSCHSNPPCSHCTGACDCVRDYDGELIDSAVIDTECPMCKRNKAEVKTWNNGEPDSVRCLACGATFNVETTDTDTVALQTVAHLAGPAITLGSSTTPRVIQRCSICGEKLCDSLNVASPVGPDGIIPPFPTWPVGHMVRITPGNPTEYRLLEDLGGKLPGDSCIVLIE